MGFFDEFLKKLGTTLATRYGVIRTGEYADCNIALGNPPDRKVEKADAMLQTQMVIIREKEEIARLDIEKDIESVEYIDTIKFPATGKDGYRCEIAFSNGSTCEADLFPSKIRVIYANLGKKMSDETCEFIEKEIKRLSQMQ